MTVFVLIREDQNEHGYVDTSIAGIFRDERAAAEHEQAQRQAARAEGLLVEDDESPPGEWQVSWKIEEHFVDPAVVDDGRFPSAPVGARDIGPRRGLG